MEKNIIVTLALLCAMAFLIVEVYSHRRHRLCEVKNCQCPPELNASSCINWQEWDNEWCECYCPYSKNHKCSSNKVWNYEICNCDCINEEPKGGCINGRWNKTNCQCIPYTITTTTTKRPVTTAPTQAPTQAATQALTEVPVTTPPVICSYNTKVYNNEESIDGIVAGLAGDATTAYVGITEINGIFIPGTLMLNNSFFPGLSYSYNNSVKVSQISNVFYLTQTPGCNCQFFNKNATLPANSYIVTLNNGTNAFGIGSTDDAGKEYNVDLTIVGNVINENLHYLKGYLPDAVTTNYKILVCGAESVMPTTTTAISTTTVNSSNNSTISTDDYEKRLDDAVNEFTNAVTGAIQSVINIMNLENEMIAYAQNILTNDSTKTQAEAFAYQQFLNLVNSLAVGSRKKRQIQTIDTCLNATQQVEIVNNAYTSIETIYNQFKNLTIQGYYGVMNISNFTLRPEVADKYKQYLAEMKNLTIQKNACKKQLTELTAIRDEVCSKTTTTISTTTTAAPAECFYLWSSYQGKNVPAKNAFYVGKNPYGHDIYVGAGTVNNDFAPGSLEPLYLNGVTIETGNVVYNVTTNVRYLAVPSMCSCQWLPNGDLYSMPRLVKLNSYWIGRYNFTDGSQVVGEVYDQDSGNGIIMSYVENNQVNQSTNFEVLQCFVPK